MSKYIDADRLKSEIERLYAENKAEWKLTGSSYHEGAMDMLDKIEQLIDYLQQEQPEDIVVIAKIFLDALSKTPYNNKPITDAQIIVRQLLLFLENPKEYNPDAILEQPEGYFFCKFGGMLPKCADCARNHANSSYDVKDIDTWMQPGTLGTKQCSDYIRKEQPEETIDKSLDEAAEESAISQYSMSEIDEELDVVHSRILHEVGFKAGAKWQKEQMMKESVEHYVIGEIAGSPVGPAIVHYDENLNIGDKVRVIIVKEEEDK